MAGASTSPVSCSSTPSLVNDPSVAEELRTSPLNASTDYVGVSMTNADKIVAELLGTYIIIFMGCGSMMVDKWQQLNIVGVALTWGLVVMVMIYTLGHVSGGHFNPAVTIAFAASGKFPWRQVPAFAASQLAGSTLAICTLSVMFHNRIDIHCTISQYVSPTTQLEAFAWEFIISFILMLAICGIATDSRAINELSGITVGSAVLVNFMIAGEVTGASMNPARSLGPALVTGEFHHLWVYILAPVFGTLSACLVYNILRPHEKRDAETPKRI